MTTRETITVDSRARVTLPRAFAKTTVVLEQISDSEIRIHKARATGRDRPRFPEEEIAPLSDRDRDRFVRLLENPPRPNSALRKAMSKHRKQHG